LITLTSCTSSGSAELGALHSYSNRLRQFDCSVLLKEFLAMAVEQTSDERIQLKRRFADFLDRPYATPEDPQWSYGKGLADLYTANDEGKAVKLINRRVVVSEHHLREFDESLLQSLLTRPAECLPAFEDALNDYIKSGVDPTLIKLLGTDEEIHIGLKGDFGRHEVSPRELTSSCLGQLVCLFGIVTKCSLVRPKLVKTVHYCEETKAFTTQDYRDVTSLSGQPTGVVYPTKDSSGHLLTTEFGLSKYKDSQTITMQELPETAPPGQLPHSAEVVLEDDLVDQVKPGDRVALVGVYKAVAGKVSGPTTGVFRALVVGVSVQKLSKESQVKYTVEEARLMRQIAERPDALPLLARSLAPSIYGHAVIKKGLTMLLFGGLEKNLANGTHLRGDVNCLLVGDPGVAKSQMLRAVMNIAPHAVSTTGRGSSGVGLTAAVTTDSETGEKRLEAGAMVLADRGVVCIDEFDKMSDQDRVAIHEVMEQQTVTIAKAGIHCSLNARCSVLAAANPLYGSYDKSISVTRNVNLPDSLLSRFDMLFVVLDCMDEAKDRQMALHVLAQHRYRPAGEDGKGAPVQETIHDRRLSMDSETSEGPAAFLKADKRMAGGAAGAELLTADFLRKYIIYARRRQVHQRALMFSVDSLDWEVVRRLRLRYAREGVKIAIEDEAAEEIVSYYSELRRLSRDRALPITARTLETIIRLATSSCKLRLRFTVDRRDVEIAKSVLDHCLKKTVGETGQEADDEELEDEAEQPPPAQQEVAQAGSAAGQRGGTSAGEGGIKMEVMSWLMLKVPPQLQLVRTIIDSLVDEFTDDTIPVEELQARVTAQGMAISTERLESFLQFCSDNYDKPAHKGRLPPVLYMPDNRAFVVCT
ncbi:hypothetical protein QJQ45_021561, partial [Haematococcus lacustris]